MIIEFLESTADLRRVQKQMRRRVVKLHVAGRAVQVTRCGCLYRARLSGHPDSVLASTPAEAKQRLSKLLTMGRVTMKTCDAAAEKVERRAKHVAAKAAKNSVKYSPRGKRWAQ
jgi:hypothetical protein